MTAHPDPARDARPPLLVSACLLGVSCNHLGRGSPRAVIDEFRTRYRLIPVCPEVAGGLPVPRDAAEIQSDGRVVTTEGDDVTDAYERGAAYAVELAHRVGAKGAVLKARSPSCGSAEIYDGSFSASLVEGSGKTAAALWRAGIEVRSEEDAEAFLAGPPEAF